ncbi:hypothetical protein FGB62_23g011 [Gracilaria domingensis]|nr:hypothetical protein FGB62_23g011 [Gracilaria domingensis]
MRTFRNTRLRPEIRHSALLVHTSPIGRSKVTSQSAVTPRLSSTAQNMNQGHMVGNKPSVGKEKAAKKERRSRPDALGLLSSLVSHDEALLKARNYSASEGAQEKHVTFAKRVSISGPDLLKQQSSSSYISEVTPSSARLDSYRNLYSYRSGPGSRASSRDEPEGLAPHEGQCYSSLSNIETLSQKNEKCVRKTLSQDWLKRTFSPRPCTPNEKGTLGSLSARKRQSLVSISEETEYNEDEESDLSDTKSGDQEGISDSESYERIESLSLKETESGERQSY